MPFKKNRTLAVDVGNNNHTFSPAHISMSRTHNVIASNRYDNAIKINYYGQSEMFGGTKERQRVVAGV